MDKKMKALIIFCSLIYSNITLAQEKKSQNLFIIINLHTVGYEANQNYEGYAGSLTVDLEENYPDSIFLLINARDKLDLKKQLKLLVGKNDLISGMIIFS